MSKKPTYLEPWICPDCGGDIDDIPEGDSNGESIAHDLTCPSCGCEWVLRCSEEPHPVSIDYAGEEYQFPPSDEERVRDAAPELLEALENITRRAAYDAETYAQEGNEPIWAFIADATDAIAKAREATK